MTCAECQNVTGLVCEACGAIPPPRSGVDKFAALGVPRRFALDPERLEARYRELSRRLHPDRFARAEARERMLSLQAATTLNDAYRTLRRPIPRAEYLLELEGLKLAAGDRVPEAFLLEIMALREGLAEAKAAGDAARLAAMFAAMRARRDASFAGVEAAFAELERGQGERAAILARIKDELVNLRYFQRFLDEEQHEPAADQ